MATRRLIGGSARLSAVLRGEKAGGCDLGTCTLYGTTGPTAPPLPLGLTSAGLVIRSVRWLPASRQPIGAEAGGRSEAVGRERCGEATPLARAGILENRCVERQWLRMEGLAGVDSKSDDRIRSSHAERRTPQPATQNTADPGSSNGKTAGSEPAYRGSNPCPGAIAARSSRGLGRRPLTAVTRVRIPLGLPKNPYFTRVFCFLCHDLVTQLSSAVQKAA